MAFFIKKATSSDAFVLLELILELASYEKMLDEVSATHEQLKTHIFDHNHAQALLFYEDEVVVGFTIYFFNYSTFTGRPGLYIEDIYMKEMYRGRGYGKQVFKYLSQVAINNDCARMEWSCLDWNTPSIAFYLKIGAKPMEDWTVYRLDEEGILALDKTL